MKTLAGLGTLSGSIAVGWNLILANNESIENLEGLEWVNRIGEDLIVLGNSALKSLGGLDSLSEISGEFRISYNGSLQNLADCPALMHVGELKILGNPSLETLEGLPQSGYSITGNAYIANNPVLNSVDAISSLNIEGDLVIQNNILLNEASALTLKEILIAEGKVQGNIHVEKNMDWPDTDRVWMGDYTISKQEDLTAISGYSIITGTLKIENGSTLAGLESLERIGKDFVVLDTDLVDFKGLENLSYVAGNLSIIGNDSDMLFDPLDPRFVLIEPGNRELKTLQGLDNLSSIGGSLVIAFNASLENINRLKNLKALGGNIRIVSNPSLTDIQGFEGLSSIGSPIFDHGPIPFVIDELLLAFNDPLDNLSGASISITYNNLLSSLEGLRGLSAVPGDLSIDLNPNLISIDGLDNLTSVEGNIYIIDNSSLKDLKHLGGLISIKNSLRIGWNSSLTDMTGIDNLCSVGGDLVIDNNDNLIHLDGFPALTSIGEDLWIVETDALSTITGFANLKSIDHSLSIYNNENLINFEGFHSLTSVGGGLCIYANDLLTGLEGFENLTTVGSLAISDNPSLTRLGLNSLTSVGMNHDFVSVFPSYSPDLNAVYGFYISQNKELCDQTVEELLNQIVTSGEIGGQIEGSGNKTCP